MQKTSNKWKNPSGNECFIFQPPHKHCHPNEIRNNCFEVKQQDGELLFDYKLHPGVTQSHNATYLLRKMGLMEDDE